eukprot:473212-Hanusia_phi.AAC.1
MIFVAAPQGFICLLCRITDRVIAGDWAGPVRYARLSSEFPFQALAMARPRRARGPARCPAGPGFDSDSDSGPGHGSRR